MQLHEYIAAYNSLLDHESARETFEQLDRGQRERRLLVGQARDRLVCGVLRPRFVTEQQYRTLQPAAEALGRAIQQVGAATLGNPALLKPYELSDTERALLALDPGYSGAAIFGRLDGFLADDGGWCWFVESNLESPAGIAYEDMLLEIFGGLPVMQEFARRHQVRSFPLRQQLHALLLNTYREWGGVGTPSLAIVDYRSAVTWPEFEHLQAQFSAAGTPTILADPAALRYDGQRLWAVTDAASQGVEVDLVYRRILQHEFLARYDLDHPLVRAYADGKVCVVNPWRSKPVHTKLIMALLSDEDGAAAGLLDAGQRAAVQAHVPWTRHLRPGPTRYQGALVPDLPAFCAANRERLVLKPNDDYGGSGVLLGWTCNEVEWRAGLLAAQSGPWVVQERVPLPEEQYPTWSAEAGLQIAPRYVDSDPCIFGPVAAGCLTRIAATPLLNVSAGGGAAPPTFLVA